MNTAPVSPQIKNEYTKVLAQRGEAGLYKWIIGRGITHATKQRVPFELELLNASENFFALCRSTGDMQFFIIGRTLRKAAHKLYRIMLKIDGDHPVSQRFLSIIK